MELSKRCLTPGVRYLNFFGIRLCFAAVVAIGGSFLWLGGVAGAKTFDGCGGRASISFTLVSEPSSKVFITWGGVWPAGGKGFLYKGWSSNKNADLVASSDSSGSLQRLYVTFPSSWTVRVDLPALGNCLVNSFGLPFSESGNPEYEGYWHGPNNPYNDLAGFLGQADRLH